MNYVENWNCQRCLQSNPFGQSTITRYGETGVCNGCNTQAIYHNCCQGNAYWLPILMTGISIACPACKTAYQISENIIEAPSTPEWLKIIAAIVAVAAISIGVVKIGQKLEEAMS